MLTSLSLLTTYLFNPSTKFKTALTSDVGLKAFSVLFEAKVEVVKFLYVEFLFLVCNGLSLKMKIENQLFTMLKFISEGSWVQTPYLPS